MKKGKHFGACALAAAMVFSAAFAAAPKTEALAAEVTKTEEINAVLDTNDSTNMYQLSLAGYAGSGELQKIVATVTFAQPEALGWVGGGGAIGYSTDGDWQQVDFEHQFVDGDTNTVDIVVEIPDGINVTYDEGSIIQVGWWWGSTSYITLDKISLVFESADAADDTAAPAQSTETAPSLPKTGLVSSVVFLAAGALLSGTGAVVVKGKKKD